MQPLLTNNDLIQAAKLLGCDVAAIRAVDEVESSGQGFDKLGNIKLRFETAKFLGYTGKSVIGSGQSAFDQAYGLNPHAALMSTSWGRYQVMGFNYGLVGYGSVEAFVAAMKQNEQNHLAAFTQFVLKKGLAVALTKHDWDAFAYRYNGADYKAGNYDGKLAAAYAKYRNQDFPATNNLVKKKPTPAK